MLTERERWILAVIAGVTITTLLLGIINFCVSLAFHMGAAKYYKLIR